jgi:PKD repeat protein
LGGDACGVTDLLVARRPFEPSEILYIAESGINITPTYYSVQDPRLKGFWPCTDVGINDLLIPDRGMIFSSGGVPGHLIRIISDDLWNILESSETQGQHFAIDMHSHVRDTTLGITSGVFTVMSATEGIGHTPTTTGEHSRTSSSDYCQRYRMYSDERSVRAPAYINQYLIGFEVTPSGNIPAVFGSTGKDFNSTLFYFGEATAVTDHVTAYLTSAMAPAGSGITIVFQTQDGTNVQPLVSGNIPYGVTSKILFSAKPLSPFTPSTTAPIECTLFVGGVAVNSFTYANNVAQLYDLDAPGTSDNWLLQIGGRSANDTYNLHSAILDGLGGIYLRNIYVMVGNFSGNDLLQFAASGINPSSNIANYKDTLNAPTVFVTDTRIEGYWRFSGPDSASGITDLSLKGNDLAHMARSGLTVATFAANAGNTANIMRFVPGPFTQALLPIQASGLTFKARQPPSQVTTMAPYAISGAMFQIPQSGFTIAFWVCPRESFSADAGTLVSYGAISNTLLSTTFSDSSWCVTLDDDNNIVLILSQDGTMALGDTSDPKKSSQTKCKIARVLNAETSSALETFRQGQWQPGNIDAWRHVAFTFSHSPDGRVSGICKGYHNGEKVSEASVPASGFHQPLVVESRIMSILVPQTGVWKWDATRSANSAIITDVLYASSPLSDEEIRFVAMFGLSPAASTVSSGIIGSYVPCISGTVDIIGGYISAVNIASGIMGGYVQGGKEGSGIIGGYIAAAAQTGSGIIGGFVPAATLCSGVIGGYIASVVGTTQEWDASFTVEAFAASDFDAQLRINKTGHADFDAQVIVYQEERPPDVAIIIPNVTVSGTVPFNQYFIGSGRALQNKTIVQAKFYFNDFTAPVLVSTSGNDLYPFSHVFGQSGIFVVRFSVIDSNGQHNSATRIVDLSSGVAPVQITISGIPVTGVAPLSVQFQQTFEVIPPNVIITASYLTFDDGQSSIILNDIHAYTETGKYNPVWIVQDSRGCIWCDSLTAGVDN